jgi:outer membrane protein insertion porin family
VRDSRDNIFDASRGSYNILSLTMAGGYLGGDRHFIKPVFDSRLHFTTPAIFGWRWLNKFVLGLHGRAGYATPYDAGTGLSEVPVSERFFMGGTDTVRGYFERSLGASNQGGGLFTLLSNVEYGFKPAQPIKLRAFYDSGNAWADINSMERGLDGSYRPFLYPSWGLGMLFTIPTSVIQIRLDWGFPLLPKDTPGVLVPDGGRIHFNIGNIF